MEEQRTWVRVRRKRRLRILAVMLSVCVLVTTYPDIPVALAFSAAEESERPEGRYIVGFTALSKEIREQTVPVGTELTELSLPETLEAVIIEERQPSEDTAEKSEDSEKEDTGENHGEEKDGDTAGTKENDGTGEEEDGEPFDIEQEKPEEDETSETQQEKPEEDETSETKQEEPEEGEASETKQEEPEEGEASEIQQEEPEEGEASEIQQEEPEEGEPSETQQEDRNESGNTDADGETGDGQDTQSEDGGESGGTDESNKTDSGDAADTENQETHTVSMPEYYAEHVISVQTLENTSAEEEKEPQTEEREETKAEEQREPEKKGQEATVTISGVSWQAEPAYDGSAEGTYIFTAVLPEGYALAEDVSLPEITVTVCKDTEKETVTAAGTLLEELMEKYFAGLSADEIYDVILAMDEDTRLSMTADYEEVIAAMTDADEADERLQSIIKTIERGLMDAAERIPRREPAFFSVRAAAPQTAQSIPLRKLSGSGKAFVYYDFVETVGFANGTEHAFLDGVYGHDDAVCALGSGAILKVSGESNLSEYYIQERYGSSADVKVYVDVIKKGKDFDYCRHGGLYQVPGTGSPTEYRYFCYGGGARNCGPYYAYTYQTMTLTDANVSATLNDIDRQGSDNSGDYTVTLTFDGRTLTLDQGSYTVNVSEQDSDEVTIVVTDNDGNSITTKFRGPLAVHYDGNGEGAENVPAAQAAWRGESVTVGGTPTRAGYSFENWKEEKTGSAYTKGQTVTLERKSLRLLAQWKDVQAPDVTSSNPQVMIRATKSEVEQMVKASLIITDNEPVNECTVQVTVADDITRSVGEKKVRVTVTDRAGNTTTKDVPITVISLSLMIDKPVFTQSSKNLSAALLSPGGDAITETGIVWGIMTSPTTSVNNGKQKTDPAVTQADAKISVTADIQKGVTYYARAYAISGGVTYYSNELSFGLDVPQYGTFTIKCAGSNTFTVMRTGGRDGAQTVYYRTVNGSAVGGTHFTHKSESLIFAAGETSKTITIAEAGGNAAYSGKPATGYSNADRTYSVEIYRVTGGGMLGDTVRAERTMTAGADYKIDRGIYTEEKAVVNVALADKTNGKRIADTTTAQGGATDKVSFLTNRYNEKNYNTSTTLASYYTNDKEKEYLKNTATGWYYRYDLLAYEHEDGYEHAYMGTKPLNDENYQLGSDSAAITGVAGQLWACNFLQGEKDNAKHYYFPDTRTNGGESAGYPKNSNGTVVQYNGSGTDRNYVDLNVGDPCYVYFGSTGKNDDIWYVDGLTSYAIVHDKTEPQLVAVAPMAGGLYKAGDSFVVSLIFDEIVDSQNSTLSNVKVSTNWGDAVYTGGADTNVLYFTGTVKAGASGNLSVTGISNPGNIKDMCAAAGTACVSKSGNTTASVDSAEPKLTLTSNGVKSGIGTVTVKVDADRAKTSALRYAWSASTVMPASGWVEASATELSSAKGTAGLSLSIRKEPGSGNNGEWYLHVIGIYDTTGAATHKYAAVNFGTAESPVSPAPKTPTLSVSADNSNWAKSRNITVTMTNAGSGTLKYCKAGRNSWTALLVSAGSINVTENGWYTFRLTSGEHILTQDVEVKMIDNINPTAAVGTLTPAGSNQTQKAGVYTKITLPVTFGDSGSGVQTVQYRWTDTAAVPTSGWSKLNASQIAAGKADISYTASENTETAKYLHVKVTDKLGNICTTKSAASYQVISQTAVNSYTPKIAMTGAPAKWTNDTVTLTWTLSEYSGKNYEVILPDGRKAKSNAGSGEVWALRNGTYTVKVRDLDYGGENTATVTVQYIDTTAPTVTVPAAPAGWKMTGQTVTFRDLSDSQSGVGKKYYKIITAGEYDDLTKPGAESAYPTEGLTELSSANSVSINEDGVYYVYYKFYDNAGDDSVGREANKTEGFVGPIQIDKTAPDVPVLQENAALPEGWTNTKPDIPLKLQDGVGVTELLVSIDGGSYEKVADFTGSAGAAPCSYEYTGITEGNHTYCFQAKDVAGNISAASDIFTVKLDQTKPEIGTITYENKAANLWQWIIGKTSLIIHVPVTDTGSGVTEISFCLTPRDAAGNPDSGSAVTDTATVSGGEAKITFDADFRGTIAIHCTDAAGNAADSVTIGADAGGVIVEDKAPDITIQADRNPSDTQQTQPDGVAVADGYYDTAPALLVKVKDDTDNEVTGGLASVTYQVGDGAEKTVTVDQSTLQKAAQAAFTIPVSEIPTGITKITVTAADNAGNEASESITVKVKGPEKTPRAEIDYREEELKNLVPGEKYTIDGTEYTADQEGRIPLIEDWLGTTVSIVKKGSGSETTDSPAQSLPVPARPAAPHAPELGVRDDTSITLQTIAGAHYRLADGTGNWQDSTGFEGLKPGIIYSFQAYYLATDTSFASPESSPAQIATVPAAPTKEKLKIGYGAETLTLTDGIEAFTDAGCTTPVTADSAEAYMGQTIYIRYPAKGVIPESLTTPVLIPARPAKPTPGTEDASYPKATDGAVTGLTSGKTYEYRIKNKDGSFSEWKDVLPNGTRIENLPAGEYEVRVKAVETGNVSFRSETAAVTIGEKPATKYDTPDIHIDYAKETLTGFVTGAKYTIGGETITAGADGALPIKKEWFGTALSIMQNGNGKDKLDSAPQSLSIPARPGKPTPTGVDVSTAGGTGKLTGLTAGVAYEVSADGGSTWVSRTADGSGQITELAPGTYVVRVKAGTSGFASENSDRAEIGAYQVKVTFMANGENYKEVSVDYGGTLTDIPAVPPQKDGGDQTYASEWCSDQQGTPAVFTDLTADMTVYAVYTATYAVALQGGTGYTLSAQAGSTSPVKEGGSYTFGFALSNGYQKTAGFAVKVNGGKAELTADGTYTISDIRENKTVTVEGVAKKPGKPSDSGGDKDKEDDSKSESEDPTPQPSVTPPGKGKGPTPGTTSPAEADRPVPEQQKKETAGNSGRGTGTQPTQGQIQEPEKQGESENRNTAADSENQNRQGKTVTDNGVRPDSGTVKSVTAAAGQGRIVISGEKIPTGNVAGMEQASTAMTVGEGAVFVTVVCQDEIYAAGVKDTVAVANSVLSPDHIQLVNDGETIEIRVDITDISQAVPQQDKDVIESGLMEYQKQVPALTLGRYVDISMFMKIGENGWNAITSTEEPIEVVIGIPEDIQEEGREFYIIRAHEGEHTFMRDLDEEPDTVTISTDMFSSYAIAYVETDGTEADNGGKCGLCHICPTFLGICCFIWLAAAIVIFLLLAAYILRRKREE